MRILLFTSVWILILLPAFTSVAFSQKLPPPPDSLRSVLLSAKNDRAKAIALLRISRANLTILDTAAHLYAREAELLAIKLNDKHLEGEALNLQGEYFLEIMKQKPAIAPLRSAELLLADAPARLRARNYHNLGVLYDDLNQQEKAIPLYHKAYNIYKAGNDKEGKAELSNALGVLHSNQARYDSAAHYLFRAVKEFEIAGKNSLGVQSFGNIAVMYFQQGRFKEALPYAMEALELAKRSDDSLDVATSHQNVGSIKLKLNDVDGALFHFHRTLAIYKWRKLNGYLGNLYNALAIVHEEQKQIDSAAYYLRLAIKLTENQGQGWAGAMIMGNLAILYKKSGRNAEAEYWALKAISKSRFGTDPPETLNALYVLEAIEVERQNYKAAFNYSKRVEQLNKKQYNIDHAQITEELRMTYEIDKAEQQVNLLRQEQELAELRQQQQIAVISGGAALFLVLAGFFFWRYRTKQHLREANLRTRIAADLHDDVGSLLTQISLQGSLLEEDVYNAEERKKQLSQLGVASRRAVQQMSDVVWAVDARNDGFSQLLNRMRDYAFELLSTAGIEIDFDAPASLPDLPNSTELRQNLYFIFKEALHNTVKHSNATQVQIRLQIEKGRIKLEIKDNGNGKEGVRLTGQGLRNMQMRAEAVGGKITFVSEQGFGVRLTVPVNSMNML